MPRVAIIGGIGSGKTAVTDYLALQGASVVDADVVARRVVEPGKPAWEQLRDAFGSAVLLADGSLDRAFVAEIVFNDPSALRRLNHITHTAIGLEMASQISRHKESELVAVALPLFRPVHRELLHLDEVWCVWVSPDLAEQRLVEQRHFTHADAIARIKAQASNDERLAQCEIGIENSGTLEELHLQVRRLLDERGWLRG